MAKPARLTLVKNVSGGQASASDWTLTATGPTTISGKTGDAAITNASVDAGTYALSESTGPANYVAGTWRCGDAAMDGASISLEADESATCTITNTYNPPEPETGSLKITKKLTGDLTGFAGGDFTFSVTCDDESYGPVTINLSSGSASASPITGIPAGADCTVNETDKPLAGTYAGWDAPTYSPSATVPIVSGQEATVEVRTTEPTPRRPPGTARSSSRSRRPRKDRPRSSRSARSSPTEPSLSVTARRRRSTSSSPARTASRRSTSPTAGPSPASPVTKAAGWASRASSTRRSWPTLRRAASS